ncbi:MAG: alpha/beta hydrolase [bacterium]|nr:alpha/beta hydrolase [Candidatus Kapabacteria bacterium]
MNTTFINRGATRLAVIDVPSVNTETCVVVLPGMGQSAEDFASVIGDQLERRTIYVSFRGRGHSDAPESGYSFDDHVADLAAIVDGLGLDTIIVVAHSMSVPFAIAYALENMKRVSGLVLHDYPAAYPKLPDKWVERILAQDDFEMPEHVVRMLAAESDNVVLFGELTRLTCPVLVTGGTEEDAFMEPDLAAIYQRLLPNGNVHLIEGIGHDPLTPSAQPFVATVLPYLKEWSRDASAQ